MVNNYGIKLGTVAIDRFEKFQITAPSRIEWHRDMTAKQSLDQLIAEIVYRALLTYRRLSQRKLEPGFQKFRTPLS